MTTFARTAVLLLMASLSGLALAADPPLAEPILLTSCGQTADVLMVKLLLAKDSLRFSYLPTASGAEVSGQGSVMLVLGGSSKGLGAAKISVKQETARVTALLDSAQQAAVPIVAVHIGGQNRRGALSDPFNRLGAERAARLIVVKGGNDDGFFTKIADGKKIPLDSLGLAQQLGDLLLRLYRPPAVHE
jgi:hypothetical protein